MNTHGIHERAGDEHILHQPQKWVRTEKEKARERKRIDRALLLEAVGLIRRDPKTKRWVLI